MRKILVLLAAMIVSLTLYAEKKPTVAVMEIEDRSGQLDKAMLGNAAEYLRSELAATNNFILISKDRQIKEMVKAEKKESYRECYDQSCRIQLGQALSADTVTYGSITLFGGIYTISMEMIDLAKEATVKAAKADFDGTEKGLREAVKSIVVHIAYGKNPQTDDTKESARIEEKKTGINTSDLYNNARDMESNDKERAIEIYHDIIDSSASSDKYYQKALERLVKLGDTKSLRQACAGDNANACNELGNQYIKNNHIKEAAENYTKACVLGNGWGCYGVAERLVYGELGKKDFVSADKFYKKACEKGVKEGCKKQGLEYFVDKYAVYKNGIVLDTETNLMWQRESENSNAMHWLAAKSYCSTLKLGDYSDWRLPTINELRTTITGCADTQITGACGVTDTCIASSCKDSALCECKGNKGPGEDGYYWQKGVWNNNSALRDLSYYFYFWSASERSDNKDAAWYVRFDNGEVNYFGKNGGTNVRCVRGEIK